MVGGGYRSPVPGRLIVPVGQTSRLAPCVAPMSHARSPPAATRRGKAVLGRVKTQRWANSPTTPVVVLGREPIQDAHVARPGLVVVEIAAAGDATALALQAAIAERLDDRHHRPYDPGPRAARRPAAPVRTTLSRNSLTAAPGLPGRPRSRRAPALGRERGRLPGDAFALSPGMSARTLVVSGLSRRCAVPRTVWSDAISFGLVTSLN